MLNTIDINTFNDNVIAFGKLGLDVHITELELSIYSAFDSPVLSFDTPPQERIIAQAYFFQQLFEMFKAQKKYVKSVTFWNVDDGTTWLNQPLFSGGRKNWPLLFDKYLLPKPQFWEVLKV